MERIFRIAPSENFIEKLSDFMLSLNVDLSRITVIFPNIRPSYYLRRSFFKKAPKIFLPHIYSIDEFVDILSVRYKTYNKVDFCDVLWLFVDRFSGEIKKLFKHNITNDDIMFLSEILLFEFEELYINKISPQKIKEYDYILSEVRFLPGIKNFIKSSRSRIFRYSYIYREFYNYLEKNNKYTRAMKYVLVSDRFKGSDIKKDEIIIVAGFFLTTRSEKEIFSKIFNQTESYFFFKDHPLLDEKIDFVKLPKSNSKFNIPSFTIHASPSKHSQIFMLKEHLSSYALKSGDKLVFDTSTAIIIPDTSSLWPMIENVLGDISEFNITAPYPLTYTQWGSFFKSVRDFVSEMSVKGSYKSSCNILSLLKHPYIKESFLLDVKSLNRAWFFIKDDEIREIFKNQDDANKFETLFVKNFLNVRNIKDFLQSVISILNFAMDINVLDSYVLKTAEMIKSKLEEALSSLVSDISFEKISSYFDFLEKIISELSLPFKGHPLKGLQCMGLLESRLLDFENVFILDMNDGVIPPQKNNIYFLSDIVRKNLGLSTYRDSVLLYYYYIYSLISSAKNVNFYYIDNKSMAKSPILEKLIWETEKEKGQICQDIVNTGWPSIKFASAKTLRIVKTQKVDAFLKEMYFSPSAVDLYLTCPLRFYYNYVLGIEEEKCSDIEKRDIGTILHMVLERTFKNFISKKVSDMVSDEVFTFVERYVDECIDENLWKHLPQNYFIRIQMKKRAKETIRFLSENFSDFVVFDCEKMVYKTIKGSNGKDFKLKGKVDLILTKDNKGVIVDFKTGSDPKNYLPRYSFFNESKRSKTPNSIQMPFYILLFKDNYPDINSFVITLGSKECKMDCLFSNADERVVYEDRFSNFILQTINEILESKEFVAPEDVDCSQCPYSDVCI